MLQQNDGQKEYVLIQYPGIIKDTENALRTLGGLSSITQNHYNGKNLELRHTPDNPYTSCVTSEKKIDSTITSGTMRLIIKLRRKKKDKTVCEATCMGLVNYMYTFESMCDFQFIPLRRHKDTTDQYSDLIPVLVPNSLEAAFTWWDNEEDNSINTPLFLPPFQFSRYNTPSTKILCRETDFSIEKTRRKTGHGQNLRVERKALSITVHAEDVFPDAPTQDAIDDANFRCKNPEPHRMMTEIFEERPMWTRVAVSYKTGLDDNIIKYLLQKYAFYIQSGPWGRLWCKFGYDPRLDPESKLYQTLMVTFRQHTKIPERQRLKVSIERSGPRPDNKGPISYIYTSGSLPKVRQMWYSICDIQLDLATQILNQDYTQATDVPKSGWIPTEIMQPLRAKIKEEVNKLSNEIDVIDDDDTLDDSAFL